MPVGTGSAAGSHETPETSRHPVGSARILATSPRPKPPDPLDDAFQRSVPMTVITRSPDTTRRATA